MLDAVSWGGIEVVFRLKPREEKFFTYFKQLADGVYEAVSILKNFIDKPVDAVENLERLNEIEERGDKVLSTVIKQINSSFITPFDREDILLLARELNNVLDHIQGILEKIVIYKAELPQDPQYVVKLIHVLDTAVSEMQKAILMLPSVRTKHSEIINLCEKIRSCEHEGDYLYRSGIALLFDKTEDIIEIIKWKEIYEHLETTLDYCENVSNIIRGVAVKYV